MPPQQKQIDRSTRSYDGAKLTWYRVFGPFEWGPWILVRVDPPDE